MSFHWDWWNLVYIVVVVALLIGAFYFERGVARGSAGPEDEGPQAKRSTGKK